MRFRQLVVLTTEAGPLRRDRLFGLADDGRVYQLDEDSKERAWRVVRDPDLSPNHNGE